MKKKARADQMLVERGFFESRERAQRAIMAGEVRVGEQVVQKPAAMIDIDAPIAIAEAQQFVGRGALKLAGALDHFKIDARNKTALDIGASTGGFTELFLSGRGAEGFAGGGGRGSLRAE